MRIFFIGVWLLLLSLTSTQLIARQPDFTIDLESGIRRDSLKWSISAPKNCPKILSELEWKDLKIWQIQSTFRAVVCKNVYFRGSADYGRIYHGHETDTDYLLKKRSKCCPSSSSSSFSSSSFSDSTSSSRSSSSFPSFSTSSSSSSPCCSSSSASCCSDTSDHSKHAFAKSKAKSNKGEVFDLSGGVGWLFTFIGKRVTIAPIIGYSHHEQHLRMNNLKVDFDFIDDISGSIPGLHSNYRARWMGTWFGVDMTYDPCCHHIRFFGTFEYHLGRFHGTGHWNLRDDFVHDFKQHAWAHGYLALGGIAWDFCRYWSVTMTGMCERWKSNHGKDRTFFREKTLKSRFNGAHWHTFQFMWSIEYRY